MKAGKSKYAIIWVETKTGRIFKVEDENGDPATPAKPADVKEFFKSPGLKYVTTVLQTHSSPGCILVNWGGNWVYICGP